MKYLTLLTLTLLVSLGAMADSIDTSVDAKLWMGSYQVEEGSSSQCGTTGSILTISEEKNEATVEKFKGLTKLSVYSEPIPTFLLNFYSGNVESTYTPQFGDIGPEKEFSTWKFSSNKMSYSHSRWTWGVIRLESSSANFTRSENGLLFFTGNLDNNGPDTGKIECHFSKL